MQNWADTEFSTALLWDRRCNQALSRIAQCRAEQPEVSFSTALGPGLRRSAYTIYSSPKATVNNLLSGHYQATRQRCLQLKRILVAQDTTTYDYHGHKSKKELGPICPDPRSRGFLSHGVVAMDTEGVPQGWFQLHLWTRQKHQRGKKRQERAQSLKRPQADKESQKWLDGLRAVEQQLAMHLRAEQSVVLIQDREADIFNFLSAPRHPQVQLLIRACYSRRVEEGLPSSEQEQVLAAEQEQVLAAEQEVKAPQAGAVRSKLFDAAKAAPVVGTMSIQVPCRPNQPGRTAQVVVQVCRLLIVPPNWDGIDKQAQAVAVSVIHVHEVDPPEQVKEPLEWTLLSTREVSTAEEAEQTVTDYTRRWTIERLHYTLKSGLKVEALQADGVSDLKNLMAIHHVVAWRLLWLTLQVRSHPLSEASTLFEPDELQVLEQEVKRPIHTAQEAVRAVARMGGHPGNPSAGEPGIKTLWLGLRALHERVLGFRLALTTLIRAQVLDAT